MARDPYLDEKPWPWPGETREDKAKRIARAYREALVDLAAGRSNNPGADLYLLDEQWIDLGAYWVRPDRAPINPDDWVNLRDAAHFADRNEKTIRVWAHRGHIEQRCAADGSPEYHLQSLIDYQRRRNADARTQG